jgi:PAS domain S-box-containing protein
MACSAKLTIAMDDRNKTKEELIAELGELRRRNAELEKSESGRDWIESSLSRQFLNLAGVIVVAMDNSQKVRFINESGCEILGYEKTDLLGKNWFDTVIPEKIRSDVKMVFQQLMEGKGRLAEYFDNVVLTRTGEAKVIAWHNTALMDDVGKITGTLSWGEDITERRKTEKKREELVEELQHTLTEVKSLKVRVPVCSWGKRNLQEAVKKHYDSLAADGKCSECIRILERLPHS